MYVGFYVLFAVCSVSSGSNIETAPTETSGKKPSIAPSVSVNHDHDVLLTPSTAGAVIVDGMDVAQDLADLDYEIASVTNRQRRGTDVRTRSLSSDGGNVLTYNARQGRSGSKRQEAVQHAQIFVHGNDLIVNSPFGGSVLIDAVDVLKVQAQHKEELRLLKEELAALSAAAAVTVTTHTHTTTTTVTTTTTGTSTTTTSTTSATDTTDTSTSLTTVTTTTSTTTLRAHDGTFTCTCSENCEEALDNIAVIKGDLIFTKDSCVEQAQFDRIVKGLVTVTGDVRFVGAIEWESGFVMEFPDLEEVKGSFGVGEGGESFGGVVKLSFPLLTKIGMGLQIVDYHGSAPIPEFETVTSIVFQKLESVGPGGLRIWYCRALTTLLFPSLRSVGKWFYVASNNVLHHSTTDFSAMEEILGVDDGGEGETRRVRLWLNVNLWDAGGRGTFVCSNNKVSAVVVACNDIEKSPLCVPYGGNTGSGCQ
jgi:hypothetical protein